MPRRAKNPAELVLMSANPAELVLMGANPQSKKRGRRNPIPPSGRERSLESASENYEAFHGRPAQHVDTFDEPSPRPVTTSEVGDLIDLQVKRPTGWKWAQFNFTGRNIKLARNVEGTQLYFIGGNQKVTRGELTHTGADNSKELIDLGEAMTIAYRAKRERVNGISTTYEHPFGEITGVRPRLMYDTRGPQPRLYLAGGEYRVTDAGIEN
jgi:hypothetical protein